MMDAVEQLRGEVNALKARVAALEAAANTPVPSTEPPADPDADGDGDDTTQS